MNNIPSLDKLNQIISRLPGIGGRTAMRLSLYLFDCDEEYLKDFADTLLTLHDNIKLCNQCYSLSEDNTCYICSNENRDHKKICIVETYPDMLAIEKTEEYNEQKKTSVIADTFSFYKTAPRIVYDPEEIDKEER